MTNPPILEPLFIRYLAGVFPEWDVMLAPDQYSLNAGSIIGVTCKLHPLQGNYGFTGNVDCEMLHPERTALLNAAYRVVQALYAANSADKLAPITTLEVSELPRLVYNDTAAKSLSVCAFSFDIAGHYTK